MDDTFRFGEPPEQRAARHDSTSDGRSGGNIRGSAHPERSQLARDYLARG